jgi:hypothetical protein
MPAPKTACGFLVNAFGPREGKVAAGPFDSYAEARDYDPYDETVDVHEMPLAEFERRTR